MNIKDLQLTPEELIKLNHAPDLAGLPNTEHLITEEERKAANAATLKAMKWVGEYFKPSLECPFPGKDCEYDGCDPCKIKHLESLIKEIEDAESP